MKAFKNMELKDMLVGLKEVMKYDGKVGYAVARNTRRIQEALTEYFKTERELAVKYGKPVLNEKGEDTGDKTLKPGTEGFEKFVKEIEPFLEIEHEVEIMMVAPEEVLKLTAEEILAIDWMIKEG